MTTAQLEESPIDALTPHGTGYRAVLRNRNFLALWVGQIFSQIADRIVFVVFIAAIVHFFGANDRYNSFLYIAFTIPAILLTAIAGVFVDRWPRRAVLVSTNVLRGFLVAFLPLAAQSGNIWTIYLLAFGLSGATQFFVPAEAATIPMIVRKPQLITANSLFTTTMMASVIFGFALGDPLINIFSIAQVHWAIVGLFLLASVALLFVQTPPPSALAEAPPPRATSLRASYQDFMAEMRDGIDYILHNRFLLKSMLKLALLFSAMVALCILFVSFAKEFLFDSPEVAARKFAYIITFSGIGMVLGAFAIGKCLSHVRRAPLVYTGFITLGVCLTLMAFIGTIAKTDHVFTLPSFSTEFFYWDALHFTFRMLYTYSLAVLMGMGASCIAIPLQALIHEIIPEDKRGKILGVQFTLLSTSSTLPVLIAGLGAEQVGSKPMLLALGIPFFLIGCRGLIQKVKTPDAVAANW